MQSIIDQLQVPAFKMYLFYYFSIFRGVTTHFMVIYTIPNTL
ncbi:hypothetical protein CHCC15543_0001 [Bacillus licheniformis]|nr:hypothetical protein CHCC15543_0001 [Bacillus licheniformis]